MKILLAAMALFFFPTAEEVDRAEIWHAFDVDDTIWFLGTRIWLEETATGDRTMSVTTGEWPFVRPHLNNPNDENKWGKFRLFGSPDDGSKRELGDGLGIDYFAKTVRWALEQNPDGCRGPGYKKFQYATSTPELARRTSWFTARAHWKHSLWLGAKAWKNETGEIAYLPPEKRLVGVAHQEITPGLAGTDKSPAEAKTKQIKMELDEISGSSSKIKRWDFSDDDLHNVRVLGAKLAEDQKIGKWPNLYLTINFVKVDHPDAKPFTAFIFPNGKYVEIDADKALAGWKQFADDRSLFPAPNCVQRLGNGAARVWSRLRH